MNVARILSARRELLGVSVTKLAKASGLTKQRISQILSGKKELSIGALRKMSILLYCPMDILIAEDPSEALRYHLPPPNWLDVVYRNRNRLGVSSRNVPDRDYWSKFENMLSRSKNSDSTIEAIQ